MRTALCLMAALYLLAGVARAEDIETELKFATGLSELGYHELAAEQFEKLDWRGQARDDLRVGIALGAIENALAAAQAAGDATQSVAYLEKAATEAGALADSGVRGPRRGLFLMRQGEIQLELGRARTRLFRAAPGGAERQATAESAASAFGAAVGAFQDAAQFCREVIDRIEDKTSVNDSDRRMRQEFMVQEIAAQTQVAWAQLRRAEFYEAAGMDEEFKADLAAATASFTDLSDVHSDILAGVSAMLGRGMALAKGGEHEEAVTAFDNVLKVRGDRATSIFRFQAAYEKSASQAALGDYEAAVETLKGITEEFGSLPQAMEVSLRMRYAQTLAAAGAAELKGAQEDSRKAEQLQAKADGASRREAAELTARAATRRRKAQTFYGAAVSQARSVATAGVPESREAQVLLGRWLEIPGLDGLASPTDLFARGEAAMEAGKLEDAVGYYEQAVAAIDPGDRANAQVLHNAWVQLGCAQLELGNKAAAGGAFMQIAGRFPDSPVAEKTAVYATVLLGQVYKAEPSDENTQAYINAQKLLVANFPHNETARKAAFRLGELAREQERFADAASLYANVDRASEFYERASYLTGYSLYQEYLRRSGRGEADEAADFFGRAELNLLDFIEWASGQTAGSEEVRTERLKWAANAQLLLAQMYDTSGQPEKLLTVLDDAAQKLFASVEGGEDLVRRARLLRLAAHAMIGGEHNDLAQAELGAILADAHVDADLKAEAARVVGQNYVRQAQRLKERQKDEASITDADVRTAFAKAKDSLQQSLRLNPKQGVTEYAEVARTLYHAGAYPEAARTFRELVDKFDDDPENADAVRDARLWTARCNGAAGDWKAAVAQYEALLEDFPRWVDLRAELAGTYARDEVKRYADAAAQWKLIEETHAMGTADWFDARYERVRCLALSGKADFAYQLVAAAAIADSSLGGSARRDSFMDLAREHFAHDEVARLEELTRRDE